MDTKTWVPDGTPLDKPNPARIYDYYLGGYHNFEVDRLISDKMNEMCPGMRLSGHANRAFLRRVVEFLAAQGVDQFLDIGSGLPTLGNVHEIAQRANPAARVVYVDIDPVAVAHSQAILVDNPNAIAIPGDVHQPDQILNHAVVQELLDFSQPMGMLLLTVVNYVVDDEKAYSIVRTLRDALAPGSYIAISHFSYDDVPREISEPMQQLTARSVVASQARSHAEILPLFDGLELLEPGLVRLPLWRPEGPDDVLLDEPERALGWAGVGRKP